MAPIIVGSRGLNLPYSSLFNVSLRGQSTARPDRARPSDYFWKKATQSSGSNTVPMSAALDRENEWLDSRVPALSDSEDESITIRPEEVTSIRCSKISHFTKLRQIAFKALTTKPHSARRRSSVVTSTEIIIRQENVDVSGQRRSTSRKNSQRQTIFKSLKFKSGGSARHHTKTMSAVLKHNISVDSPVELQPKTWDEYSRLYASVSTMPSFCPSIFC